MSVVRQSTCLVHGVSIKEMVRLITVFAFFNEGFARTALVVCQKNINSFSLHVNLCSTIKTESTGLMSTPSWWRRCWKTGKTLWTLVCLCVPLCLIIVSYSSSQGEKSEKYSCGNKIFEGFFCVLLFTGIPHMHVFWDPVVYSKKQKNKSKQKVLATFCITCSVSGLSFRAFSLLVQDLGLRSCIGKVFFFCFFLPESLAHIKHASTKCLGYTFWFA